MPSWTPDYVIGGSGNNNVRAVRGTEGLIGVNPNSTNPGFGEIDTLTGGGVGDQIGGDATDVFVLGDVNNVYYQGGGATDYAIIRDFETIAQSPQPDVLQLKGTSSDYSASGNGLLYKGDLIAVFDGATQSDVLSAVSNANFI